MSPQGSPGSPGPRGPPVSHNLAALIHLIILGSTAILTLFTVYIIFLLWFWSSKTVYSSLSSSQLLIIDRLSLQLDVLMSAYVFVLGSKRSITARTERREGTETVYRVNVAPPSGSSTRPRPRNMTSHWPRPLHITLLTVAQQVKLLSCSQKVEGSISSCHRSMCPWRLSPASGSQNDSSSSRHIKSIYHWSRPLWPRPPKTMSVWSPN